MRWSISILLSLASCSTLKEFVDPTVGETDVESEVIDTEYIPPEETGDTARVGPLEVSLLEVPGDIPEVGTEAEILGQVLLRGRDLADVTLTISSSIDGDLEAPELGEAGTFRWSTSVLSAGEHNVRFTATDADGNVGFLDETVLICQWPPFEAFGQDVIGAGWLTFDDAHWNPGGWLEVTGNEQSRRGAIYKTDYKMDPGNFEIQFSIATGGGINTGADGYAVNIVNVPDVPALIEYVQTAQNGGCLGYGSDGTICGDYEIDAFHVEFDTWQNGHDPTSANHVSINLDGNASDHILWTPLLPRRSPVARRDREGRRRLAHS